MRRIQNLNEQAVLIVLVIVAVSSLVLSALSHGLNGEGQWWGWADSAFQNFSTEMMGAIITFGLFELIVGVRNKKQDLIIQLRSRDNATARNALGQIREKGWVKDGTLQRAWLWGANLQDIPLRDANLQGAILQKANLQGANLREVNVHTADLRECNLQGAHLWKINLQGAVLEGADLQGAIFLEVRFDEKTVLPDAKRQVASAN